ncbi:MAG: tyrosine-protein phosphatase [Deltaproteobacteria bacterium]|nr:tyrosine-protein phosphatase [Deltaproteobacteria bacterium]
MQRAVLVFLSLALAGCGGGDLYAGMPDHVKKRHVALEGAANFRDLGGYATNDGRTVKWGQLFRSDNLAHLTDSDLEKVSALGINLVCDFRSAPEKAEEPDRLPANDPPAVAELEIGVDGFMVNDLRERIMSGDIEGLDLREMLIEGNRQFATKQAPTYAAMFERITKPENLPALVHCTAGKDRAGFAAAAILSVLGVPRETVMADFLLTNHYTAAATDRRLLMIELFSFTRADSDALRPLFGVEPAYLEAAFAEIEKSYGDFDTYRRDGLGLDDAEVEAFRALALE